jgi:hypothetical protein
MLRAQRTCPACGNATKWFEVTEEVTEETTEEVAEDNPGTCAGKTLLGMSCNNLPAEGSRYCHKHRDQAKN